MGANRFRIAVFAALVALLTACGQAPSGPSTADDALDAQEAASLFFSEYVEGSSNSKALEIYNAGDAPVDLAGYAVEIYFNGSTSAGTTIDLAGTVATGDVFVVADDGADAALLSVADQTSTSNFFNGDDAVVLRHGDAVLDAIGQIGVDPGSQWGSGATSTQDATLRDTDCVGDSDSRDPFDPAEGWEGLPRDTFDGLGNHTVACEGNGGDEPAPLLINEFVANHTGSDTNEYLEVVGDPNTAYGAYTLLEIEGDGNEAGTVDGVFPVGTTDADGYWSTAFLANSIENGSITLLLVEGFSGSEGDDLDGDNDGVVDVSPWTALIDSVAVSDGGSADQSYSSVVLVGGYDGISFTPGGASRIPDGTDTDAVTDWTRNDFDLFGIDGFAGSPVVGEAVNTPGAVNAAFEIGDLLGTCGDPATFIYDVQGSGAESPLEGDLVVVEGIVVGDFQAGDGDLFDTDLGGFFLQEELSDADGDPATSDGIFVFEDGFSQVSVGDVVRVAGTVEEFFNLTEITGVVGLQVCSSDNQLPAPVELELSLDEKKLEPYEGMYVTFPGPLVISEYFDFDRFGEIVLALPNPVPSDPSEPGRQFQPTSFVEPGPVAEIEATENQLGRITLDDGRTSQNPDPARHPNGAEFALDNRFRGGDLVTDVTGVLSYSFGLYRIQPTEGADYASENPRPEAPAAVDGSVRVAAFNVLNYFPTIDDGTPSCGPDFNQGCRGADSEEEFARQQAKIVAALTGLDADVVGLIEIQNNAGAVGNLVDALNAAVGAGTWAAVEDGTVGGDAIKVGMIYRAAAVATVGEIAVLDSDAFVNGATGDPKNRAALAQSFADREDGGVITVVVNHFKSKGSGCGEGDDDPQQGSCNLTRTVAAQELLAWLATDPTGVDDADALVIGDLNSYDEEDPVAVFLNAGWADLLEDEVGEFVYTYVFDGQFGHLDYVVSSPSLTPQTTGATAWNINADEPDILDYDTSFKQAPQDALYEENPYRSSDHDPVLAGLELPFDPVGLVRVAKDDVARLVAVGELNRGNGRALTAKLEAALASLERDRTRAAVNQLEAFVRQVEAFARSGRLEDVSAAALIERAERAIDAF